MAKITFNANMSAAWHYLRSRGLSETGTAGLMGNLYSESAGFYPNRVEFLCLTRLRQAGKVYTDKTYTAAVDSGRISRAEFLNPLPGKQYGYGLAQWTSPGRKAGLYDLCKKRGVSISDLQTQLEDLMQELQGSYSGVLKVLKGAGSVKACSDEVLVNFEAPADTGVAVRNTRADYAMQIYEHYREVPAVTAGTILGIARGWIGRKEADGTHKLIIDKYNAHKPLARGYRVTYRDSWCDVFVSTVYIEAGAVNLIGGTECGVEEHIKIFKAAGIWKEDGTLKPEPAWIICYNWDDGTQPNTGYADHIGIVESVKNGIITVIEGNYHDSVARRQIPVGWGYIRGYAVPKYGNVAKAKTETVVLTDCYFVRKDVKAAPVNSFHVLENAKKEADKYGYNVYDASGNVVYYGKQALPAQIVNAARQLQSTLAAELKAGKVWRYRNSKLNATLALAMSNNNRYVNCVRGVQWVLQDVGLCSDKIEDMNWYGKTGGEIGGTAAGRKALEQYFNLTKIGNRTVNQLIKDGTLQTGDIVTYVSMNHTNLYLGNGQWFDSGHAYCKAPSGEAPFKAWTGPTIYGSEKVGYIIRVKGTAKPDIVEKPASSKLNETEQWIGEVTTSALNVRTYAGTEYSNIKSWPKLAKGNLVGICDTVNDTAGNPWYYIRIHNQQVDVHGFVLAKYIKRHK